MNYEEITPQILEEYSKKELINMIIQMSEEVIPPLFFKVKKWNINDKLFDYIEANVSLEFALREATDELHNCGYELIEGRWRDMNNYPNDLEGKEYSWKNKKSLEILKLEYNISNLEASLRDATDLLNDCGYELIDGVWRDMEYYPDDLE